MKYYKKERARKPIRAEIQDFKHCEEKIKSLIH